MMKSLPIYCQLYVFVENGKPKKCEYFEEMKMSYEIIGNIADSKAEYMALKSLSKTYFCSRTNYYFNKIGNDDWWLVEKEGVRQKLLDAMYGELECSR